MPGSRDALLLAELQAMGLPRVMLQAAEAIGFDAFMTLWQVLDGAPEVYIDSESGLELRLPRLDSYRRYQRNRFVESLAAMGLKQPEIRQEVKARLGEDLSDRHTRRLMASRRVRT